MLVVQALRPQLIVALGKCLRLEIPGFKIAAPGGRLNEYARQRHLYNILEVSASLDYMFPHLTAKPDDYGHEAALNQRMVGDLHHDLDRDHDVTANATTLNVNTCLSGAGTVTFANFGSDPRRAIQSEDIVHDQVLAGMVDPELADPNVHTTSFAPAESVVWREGGRSTVWHRFDTKPILGRRSGTLTVIHAWERVGAQDEVEYPTGPHATDNC